MTFDAEADRALRAATRHDPAVWRDVFLRYFDAVYRYCALRTTDAVRAENMALGAFRRAALQPDAPEDTGAPLIRRLLAAARECAARTSAAAPLTTQEGHPPPSAAQIDAVRRAHRLVGALDHATAEALVLKFALGCSFDEAADISGRPEADLKTSAYRAVASVRRRLESEDEG